MNAQNVILTGQQIEIPGGDGNISILNVLLWGFGFLALLLVLGFIGLYIQEKTHSLRYSQLYLAAVFIIGAAVTLYDVHISHTADETYKTELAAWKETTAYPYIKEQPHIDRELVSIDREPVQYLSGIKEHYVVKYKDDNFISERLVLPGGEAETPELIYDLPSGETPFVRFYKLTEDLGHGIDSGDYGLTVHLNEKTESAASQP